MLVLRNQNSNTIVFLLKQRAADQESIVEFIPWIPCALPNPTQVRLHNVPRPIHVVVLLAIGTKMAEIRGPIQSVHTKVGSQNAHSVEAREKPIWSLVQIGRIKVKIPTFHPFSSRTDLPTIS